MSDHPKRFTVKELDDKIRLLDCATAAPAYKKAKANLDRVRAMVVRLETVEAAIRKHRDFRGDDRCWMDDEELYKVLPEGYTPPERDSAVELKMCEQYIKCRHNPGTIYVSPQERINELEAEIAKMKDGVDALSNLFDKIESIEMEN